MTLARAVTGGNASCGEIAFPYRRTLRSSVPPPYEWRNDRERRFGPTRGRDFRRVLRARRLSEQLKRPLGGTKIRQPQADIRGDHSHQRHPWEIVPFGDQLRAHKKVDLAAPEVVQNALELTLAPRHIAVQPRHAGAPGRAPRISFPPFLFPRPRSGDARCRNSGSGQAPAQNNRNNDRSGDVRGDDT